MNKRSVRQVEAALFSAGRPLSVEELCEALDLGEKDVVKAIEHLQQEYMAAAEKDATALEVVRAGDKYVMQLRSKYASYGQQLSPREVPQKLLKTVSLIAYYQPVKQSDVRDMVGSKVYDHVPELEELGFVRARPHGRTKMLEATEYFYEYFGLETTDREKIREQLRQRMQG
jgi:segregation and condensation protein B